MIAIVSPGYIKGEVTVPASKSMMQRVCAAALLHAGKTIIHNPGKSADDNAAIEIIKSLGASATKVDTRLEINSGGLKPIVNTIDCGESGLSARLFIPIIALNNSAVTIKGQGSLLNRSMKLYSDILPQLDVQIEHMEGKLPITTTGPMMIKDLHLDGSESSQFLSGILFAYAFAAKEKVVISVGNLKSKPYIDLTLEILAAFGKQITNDGYTRFTIDPLLFVTKDIVEITIEGDWSSAANWLVAGAINGMVTVKGLNMNSTQADIQIITAMQAAGVNIVTNENEITVSNYNRILPFEFNAIDCPDLFPALSILAACCNKRDSSITGVHRLMNKESNRVISIADMLYGFGIYFSIEDDTLVISGRNQLEYATIDCYNDHRIVMAAAIGALKAQNSVVILDAEAVNKSYPDFFADLSSLGANCILKEA